MHVRQASLVHGTRHCRLYLLNKFLVYSLFQDTRLFHSQYHVCFLVVHSRNAFMTAVAKGNDGPAALEDVMCRPKTIHLTGSNTFHQDKEFQSFAIESLMTFKRKKRLRHLESRMPTSRKSNNESSPWLSFMERKDHPLSSIRPTHLHVLNDDKSCD